jgi:hypothetical protein
MTAIESIAVDRTAFLNNREYKSTPRPAEHCMTHPRSRLSAASALGEDTRWSGRRPRKTLSVEDDEACWTLAFRARLAESGALRFTVRRARGRRGHVLAFQPGEKLILNVFRPGDRAPADTVEAFVEYFQPRDTCGAVDVASGVLQLQPHAVLEDYVRAAGGTW